LKRTKKIKTEEYKIDKTKELTLRKVDTKLPIKELQNILESVIELLNDPKNDYPWSSWENQIDVVKEEKEIINTIKSGKSPDKDDVLILFVTNRIIIRN